MTSRVLPAACLALAMAAALAAAPAASWHAPESLTRSGDAYGASVATGGGALAVAYVRGVGAASRVELRTGTLRGRLGRDGRVAALRTISGAGESAYDPTFLPAADGETYRWR
jgi:hypothetical protein